MSGESISEGSTVVAAPVPTPSTNGSLRAVPNNPMFNQRVGYRFGNGNNAESNFAGAKDSKNTRLTVRNPDVHTVGSGREGTLNHGNGTSSVPDIMRDFRPTRSEASVTYGPDAFVASSTKMTGMINLYDDGPVSAYPYKHFKNGGTGGTKETIAMIGANGTLPNDNPAFTSLNTAAGADFTYLTGSGRRDFAQFDAMAKKNFMKYMSNRVLTDK